MTIKIGSTETISVEIEKALNEIEPSELTGAEKYCVFLPISLMGEVHMFCGECDLSEDSEDMESLLEFSRDMSERILFVKGVGASGFYEEAFGVEFNKHEKNLIEIILR